MKFDRDNPMRPADVVAFITQAERLIEDPEAAHSAVDDFMEAFIHCVARGFVEEPMTCATVLEQGIQSIRSRAKWWAYA